MSAQVAVRTPAPHKSQVVARIGDLARKHPVIVVSKLHKVRAAQLLGLRRQFRGKLEISVAKNTLVARGLREAGMPGAEQLVEHLRGQNVLIFADINPFQLYLILEKSKVTLPARAGDLATDEIVVPAGNTGIPPGPVLSEFKEANIPTRIDTGSVWVAKDAVVARRGDVIGPKLASLLARLGIKPIKAGLAVHLAYLDGRVLDADAVRIDLDEYGRNLAIGLGQALSLAAEAAYPTPDVLTTLLQRARRAGLVLSVAAGYPTDDTLAEILVRAEVEAVTLAHLTQRPTTLNAEREASAESS
ncbi:MAG: 50S ribosomal protein L10 [Burkholderiales bacterium]